MSNTATQPKPLPASLKSPAPAGKAAKTRATHSGFACMECGYKFRTIRAAEKASFGADGCPKCGGSDIDIASGAV